MLRDSCLVIDLARCQFTNTNVCHAKSILRLCSESQMRRQRHVANVVVRWKNRFHFLGSSSREAVGTSPIIQINQVVETQRELQRVKKLLRKQKHLNPRTNRRPNEKMRFSKLVWIIVVALLAGHQTLAQSRNSIKT